MKLTALAVVILALGIVLGLALRHTVFEAEAAQPTQPREDQVTIFAGGVRESVATETHSDWVSLRTPIVALDSSDYPMNAEFSLEAVFQEAAGPDETPTICVRLFDLTSGDAVSGSEVCQEQTVTPLPPTRLRSEPFRLPETQHEYTVQGKVISDGSGSVNAARVIVEWTEEGDSSVAELPPSGGTPPQQSDSTVGTPLPFPASIALGVLIIGAGGLYVAKLRRSEPR